MSSTSLARNHSTDLNLATRTRTSRAHGRLGYVGAPNPNKPIGARVRVRDKGAWWQWSSTWSKGYLVDIRASDGDYYCVLDDGGTGWYATDKDVERL